MLALILLCIIIVSLIMFILKLLYKNYELEGDFIPVDSLICCIEDLLVEVDVLQEKVEDLKEEMRELKNGYND